MTNIRKCLLYLSEISDRLRPYNHSRSSRRFRRAAVPETLEPRLLLTTRTWTGLGSDNNWTTAANWDGAVAPGDTLIFPATSARTSPINDFAADTQFTELSIQGSGYTLSGNRILLNGDVLATYTSGTSTISIPIDAGPSNFSVAPFATLIVDGPISGSSNMEVTGGGSVVFSGSNTFTGDLLILAGTLTAAHDSALGDSSGKTHVADGASLYIAGNTFIFEPLTLNGLGVPGGSGAFASVTPGSTATHVGVITLEQNASIGAVSGSQLNIAGQITDSASQFALSKRGDGILQLTNANPFNGGMTIHAGELVMSNSGAVGTGPLTVHGGTMVSFSDSFTPAFASITLGNGTTATASLRSLSGNQTLTVPVTLAGNAEFHVADGSLLNISGVIGQTGGQRHVTKKGTGTLRYSSTGNTYSGVTTTADGTLEISTPQYDNVTEGLFRITHDGAETGTVKLLNNNLWIYDLEIFDYTHSETAHATLDLNGTTLYTGWVTMSAGQITSSTGSLRVGGSITATASPEPATINSNLSFTTYAEGRFVVADGAAENDLVINGDVNASGFNQEKTGAGKLVVNGNFTGTSPLHIYHGEVQINGTRTAPTLVSVATSYNYQGILSGNGTLSDLTLYNNAILRPGAPTGSMSTGNLSVFVGKTVQFHINSDSDYSSLNVSGSVDLSGGTLMLTGSLNTLTWGSTLTLIQNDGIDAINGTLNGLAEGSLVNLPNGQTAQISYQGGDGNDLTLTLRIQVTLNPVLDVTNSQPVTFLVDFSESVTQADTLTLANSIQLTNAATYSIDVLSAVQWRVQVYPSTEGTVSVTLLPTATTESNFPVSASATYDTTAPTFQVTPNNTLLSASPVVFTITGNEPIGGVASANDVQVTNGSVSQVEQISETQIRISVIPASDGQIIFTVPGGAVTDTAGNGGQAATVSVNFALLPPVVSLAAVQTTFSPTITWTPAIGATSYIIWISSLTTGTSPLILLPVNENSFTPESLPGIGRYRVWVASVNSGNFQSPWSVPRDFTIAVPPTVSALSRRQLSSTPQLTWNQLPGAHHYEVQVNNVSTGVTNFIRDNNVSGTSWQSSNPLPMGLYRVWVRGVDAAGLQGPWSVMREFEIAAVSNHLKPDGPIFDRTPAFTWDAVPGASTYNLFVRNQNDGTTTVTTTGITTNSWTPASDMAVGPYRFWIQAVSATGIQGYWSPGVNFYVGGRPDVLTPSGVPSSRRPQITWQQTVDAVGYQLWVTRVSTNTRAIFETNLTQTNYTPTSDLQTGLYRVWVRAVSSTGGFSAWSVEREFTIV